jgi:hypothetical protein
VSTNLEDEMRSKSNEPEGGVLVDGFDPDLLDAVVPAVTGAGGPEALLAFLRERSDPRVNGIADLIRAECPWPFPAPGRGRARLAGGRVGGNEWEIGVAPPAWQLDWSCEAPDDWDFDDIGGDDPDHDAGGDGWDFDEPGGGWFSGDMDDTPVVAHPRIDRGDVETGFAACKWRILLVLLEVCPALLRRWVAVVRGDIAAALHALRGVYDPDIQIPDDQKLGWVAKWLISLNGRDPARHAALMAALWADPRLHRTGYQVLGVTHPGWTALLPGFAPPDAAEEVAALVRRGTPRRACKLLDLVAPGWQAALGRATGTR